MPSHRLERGPGRRGHGCLPPRGRLAGGAIGFAESEASGSDLHYRPAGGEAPSPIDDAIDGLIEGSPLDREAEQQWIARGWE